MKKPSTDHPTIFYGWFAILGGMIASLAHGATISVGNYTMAAMVTSAGLSPTIPGYCGSILNLCSVLFTAPLCTLITRKGHRFALLLGEGCALIAFALLTRWGANDIVLLLCYLPVGFGLVTGCKVGSPHLVSAWFQERNSLPMTLTIGIASLSAIFSGFNAENIARYGWQAGWVFLGALCVIAALAEWLLVRDDPAAVGEVVDGKRGRAQHGYPLTPASRLDGTAADAQSSHSTRTLLRDWKFLLFNTGAFFRMGTYSGCVTYVSLIIMSKGYQQTQSVAAVTLLTLASMCGCFSVPLWERCKVSEFQQNILSNGMMAVGCFLVFAGTDLRLLDLAVVFVGFGYGLGHVSQTLVLTELFPSYDFTASFRVHTSIVNLSFVFPMLFGLIGTAFGSYQTLILLLSVLNLLFAFAYLFCRPAPEAQKSASHPSDPPETEE